MELQPLDYLNGPLSIIVVAISWYVGIQILRKYAQTKNRLFLYVGFVAICTSEPWWPHVIALFWVSATGTTLQPEIYFTIGNIFIPVAIYLWLMTIAEFLYENKKKLIILLGAIYVVLYEILFFSLLIIDDQAFIGEIIPAIDVQYNPIMIGFLVTALLIILPTGVLFARESFKSDSPEIRMKGKFLMLAFFSFCIGASIDVLILSNPFNLLIARMLLVLAAIGFLGGFIPPTWIKNMFVKAPKTSKEKSEIPPKDTKKVSTEHQLAKKVALKGVLKKDLETIRIILLESYQIKAKRVKKILKLDDATFGDKIFDWSSDFGLKIEGELLTINKDKVTDFLNELNSFID